MAEQIEAAQVAVCEAMEAYLEAHEQLQNSLKEAHLTLARSKYSQGQLGQQQYPAIQHATAWVTITPAPDLQLQLQRGSYPTSDATGCTCSDDDIDITEHVTDRPPAHRSTSSPLTWFAALPTKHLREAQNFFRSSLSETVNVANCMLRLQKACGHLSDLRSKSLDH